MMFRAILLFGIVPVGCALVEPVIKIESAGDGTLVVVQKGPGLEVTALSLGSEPFITLSTEGHEETWVARYRCPPEALGLVAGRLEVSSDPEARPLPKSTRIGRAEDNDLVPIEGWPQALDEIRFTSPLLPPSRCTLLTPERLESPTGGEPPIRILLPIDAGRALAYDAHGRAFEVTPTAITPWTELSTTTQYLGAFLDARGKLTLTGKGRSAIGSLAGGFVRGPAVDGDESVYRQWVDGDPDGTELFLTGDDHRFHRFDGRRWTRVIDRTIEVYAQEGGVIWLGAGRGAAVQIENFAISEYRGGALSQRLLPSPVISEQPSLIANVFGFGTLVGSDDGSLYEDTAAGFRQIFFAAESGIRVLAPLGDGIVFGGLSGALAQAYPDHGSCQLEEYAPGTISWLIPLGDGVLAISQQDLNGTDFFHYLRSSRPACEEP